MPYWASFVVKIAICEAKMRRIRHAWGTEIPSFGSREHAGARAGQAFPLGTGCGPKDQERGMSALGVGQSRVPQRFWGDMYWSVPLSHALGG